MAVITINTETESPAHLRVLGDMLLEMAEVGQPKAADVFPPPERSEAPAAEWRQVWSGSAERQQEEDALVKAVSDEFARDMLHGASVPAQDNPTPVEAAAQDSPTPVDVHGEVYDPAKHATPPSTNKDGSWRVRRGAAKAAALVPSNVVEGALEAAPVPPPPPVAAAPVVPPPPPPASVGAVTSDYGAALARIMAEVREGRLTLGQYDEVLKQHGIEDRKDVPKHMNLMPSILFHCGLA